MLEVLGMYLLLFSLAAARDGESSHQAVPLSSDVTSVLQQAVNCWEAVSDLTSRRRQGV